MSQTLVRLLVHIVFSTKDRRNLITWEIEPELFAYMAGTLKKLDCPCLAINGASNHVHILIAMSKNNALSKVMEEVKKSSSKWIKTKGEKFRRFARQEGYGAFSIGESNIEALKKYIAEQKEHHKKKPFEIIGKPFLNAVVFSAFQSAGERQGTGLRRARGKPDDQVSRSCPEVGRDPRAGQACWRPSDDSGAEPREKNVCAPGGPPVAAGRWSRGRETSVRRASVVVGLDLRFALNAPPFALSRASLQARPTTRKTKNKTKRAKQKDENKDQTRNEDKTPKGDISIRA